MQYIIDRNIKSVNSDSRIKFIIIHSIALPLSTSIEILSGTNNQHGHVSSHYLIPKEHVKQQPLIYELVPPGQRAWHAGISYFDGINNLNHSSIGIELETSNIPNNINPPYNQYSNHQIFLLIALCKDLIKKYNINPINIIGHSDIAPGRKTDPGPFFPWQELADNNLGMWFDSTAVAKKIKHLQQTIQHIDTDIVIHNLAKFGYNINHNSSNSNIIQTIKAFQMHFRPSNHTGKIDIETIAILDNLIQKYRQQ